MEKQFSVNRVTFSWMSPIYIEIIMGIYGHMQSLFENQHLWFDISIFKFPWNRETKSFTQQNDKKKLQLHSTLNATGTDRETARK